ncbi:MAG: ABC transporter permease [Cytophagales bacterium]|nr:ABC transporter permease [Cytophagales bacterium]
MKIDPPKLPLRFFRWYCHPEYLEDIEGDLLERFERRLEERGIRAARWRFLKDVLLLFRPGIIRPAEGYHNLNNFGMFKNYLKVGFRNILKYKTFSSINIFGLAVAMSVCMLIILMLADQKSYDRFHKKEDRIYRILMKPVNNNRPYATGPFPLSATLKSDYQMVEEATCLLRGFGGDALYGQKFAEMRGYFIDTSFFKIFDFELEKGDPTSAMDHPNSMIVTHNIAKQLFGNEDPTGKVVSFADRGIDFWTDEARSPVDWGNYTITGVLADNDQKSHLEFDVLVSSSSLPLLYNEKKLEDLSGNWTNHWRSYTYVLLRAGTNEATLTSALNLIAADKFADHENLKGSNIIAQPLRKITPGPALGNAPTIRLPGFVYYILSVLALVIMLSACLNYTNLSIARAVTRSKEIGIRKVNGAKKKNLIFQFLSESAITALLALILANVLLIFLKMAFLDLWINKYLKFDLHTQLYVYLIFVVFALLIGFVAGILPALRLSEYTPVIAMKSPEKGLAGRLGIRKVMSAAQFAISLVFIITSIVIFNQFRYFMQFEYGFNAQHVVNINLQSNDYELVKNELSSIPGVHEISGCAYVPATGRNDNTRLGKPGMETTVEAIDLRIGENFIDLLDINLIAGRNLPSAAGDTNSFVLVNEHTVRALGYDYPGEIVGELLTERGDRTLEVIGVFENFNFFLPFSSRRTGPMVFRNEPVKFKFALVKIEPGNAEIIADLKEKWKSIDPVHPLDYEFYSDRLANNNQGIFDVVSIIGLVAFLAITIACLGLLGMAIYTTERRTKEIGIRKVLGASDLRLTILLSKEFLIVLAVSVSIAAPLSYFLNNFWLEFLVFRADIGLGTIIAGSMLLLILGLLSIGPQTFRVSNRNPVDSLRME